MFFIGFAAGGCVLVPLLALIKRKMRQRAMTSRLKIESPTGIVDAGYVRIGGIDQWIEIRGEDRANPVLLVLHGGPGCSYRIFTPHLRGCEKHFTIVQWDQRGSGRTFGRTGKRGSGGISFEQLTRDAEEVAEYARRRLGRERLFLLASSLGSTFGMRLARRRPELFYAYIGTDQNVGMRRGCDGRHEEVLERLRARGLWKGARAMRRAGPDPSSWTADEFEAVAKWTMRSDATGFSKTMALLKDAVWHAPDWSLKDIRVFVAGMRFSLRQLLPDVVRFDAWEDGSQFEIPFFIFQGETDVLTTPTLARAFFDDVIAPAKRFELISAAGHFACFLQPEQFLCQLLDHVRPLSNGSVRMEDSLHVRAGRYEAT